VCVRSYVLVEGVPPGLGDVAELRRSPAVRPLSFPLLLFHVRLRVPPEPEEAALSRREVADPRRPGEPVAVLMQLADGERPVGQRREVYLVPFPSSSSGISSTAFSKASACSHVSRMAANRAIARVSPRFEASISGSRR